MKFFIPFRTFFAALSVITCVGGLRAFAVQPRLTNVVVLEIGNVNVTPSNSNLSINDWSWWNKSAPRLLDSLSNLGFVKNTQSPLVVSSHASLFALRSTARDLASAVDSQPLDDFLDRISRATGKPNLIIIWLAERGTVLLALQDSKVCPASTAFSLEIPILEETQSLEDAGFHHSERFPPCVITLKPKQGDNPSALDEVLGSEGIASATDIGESVQHLMARLTPAAALSGPPAGTSIEVWQIPQHLDFTDKTLARDMLQTISDMTSPFHRIAVAGSVSTADSMYDLLQAKLGASSVLRLNSNVPTANLVDLAATRKADLVLRFTAETSDPLTLDERLLVHADTALKLEEFIKYSAFTLRTAEQQFPDEKVFAQFPDWKTPQAAALFDKWGRVADAAPWALAVLKDGDAFSHGHLALVNSALFSQTVGWAAELGASKLLPVPTVGIGNAAQGVTDQLLHGGHLTIDATEHYLDTMVSATSYGAAWLATRNDKVALGVSNLSVATAAAGRVATAGIFRSQLDDSIEKWQITQIANAHSGMGITSFDDYANARYIDVAGINSSQRSIVDDTANNLRRISGSIASQTKLQPPVPTLDSSAPRPPDPAANSSRFKPPPSLLPLRPPDPPPPLPLASNAGGQNGPGHFGYDIPQLPRAIPPMRPPGGILFDPNIDVVLDATGFTSQKAASAMRVVDGKPGGEFELDGKIYIAAVTPKSRIDSSANAGAFTIQSADFSGATLQGHEAELCRYYSSALLEPSELGVGWSFLPYSLRLRGNATVTDWGTKAATKVSLIDRQHATVVHYHFREPSEREKDRSSYIPDTSLLQPELSLRHDGGYLVRFAQHYDAGFNAEGGLQFIKFGDGDEVSFHVDDGKLASIVYGNARITLRYINDSQLDAVFSPAGTQITYMLNESHMLSTVVFSDKAREEIRYGNDHRLSQRFAVANDGTRILLADNTYDADGRMLSHRTAAGGLYTFDYNDQSRTVRITDSTGNNKTYYYDAQDHVAAFGSSSDDLLLFNRDINGRVIEVAKGRVVAAEGGTSPARFHITKVLASSNAETTGSELKDGLNEH